MLGFKQKLSVLAFSRLAIAFTLCFFTLIFRPGSEDFEWSPGFKFVLLATASNVLVSIFFYVSVRRGFKHAYRTLAYLQVVWDIIFSTCLVYLSGVKMLYVLSIVNAAIILRWWGALFAAFLSALLYAALLLLIFANRVPILFEKAWEPIFWHDNHVGLSIFVQSSLFFIVAWIFGKIIGAFYRSESEMRKRLFDAEDKMRKSESLALIGEMSARLAHEIRNPLTAISGVMQLLRGSTDISSTDAALMDVALKETDRLNQLLEKFLNYARPDLTEFEVISLGELVAEVVQLATKDLTKNKVKIRYDNESEAWIRGDRSQIKQLVWNVVNNACQAVSQDGRVLVSVGSVNGSAYLAVEDNGEGIPDALKDKIFDPFYTTKLKGSGLGLAIVQKICRYHQALIDIKSPGDKNGTVILIRFPESGEFE